MSDPKAEQALRHDIEVLNVEDILALCYALTQKPERLRLYLDVLRRKGGERAQFASCLICFDLARQGDAACQQDFILLAPMLRDLGAKEELVQSLVLQDPYLSFVWELCGTQLQELEEHADVAAPLGSGEEVATFDLISDADFAEELPDFGGGPDDNALWLRFDQATDAFLGGAVGVPMYDADAGFRLHGRRDIERTERFLRELDSVRDFVGPARGYRALTMLFLGTHLRSKSIFGAKNERKQQLLAEGLREFLDSAGEMWGIAEVMTPQHADDEVWPKIADLLYDFLRWAGTQKDPAKANPNFYVISRE